jgi:hypothetical protein
MRVALVPLAVLAFWASPASAQGPAPRPRSFEVSVGAIALGPVDFGTSRATLIANQAGAPEVTFFNAASEIGTGIGFDGRLAFNITRSLAVEGGLVWTRATLESRITSDVEGIPDVTLAQDLDTYFVEASAVWHLRQLMPGGKVLPFVAGGAGYLRQLDDEQLLTDDPGPVYHAGGGVKVLFRQRPRGFLRALGVRADARVYFLTSGVELDDSRERQTRWAITGAALIRF